MEAKFKKGQSVRIIKRNGETIDGIVRDWDYNICTFGREYNIDYMNSDKTTFFLLKNEIKLNHKIIIIKYLLIFLVYVAYVSLIISITYNNVS